MPKQRVGEGESTSSLAKKNGFFWRTIWEHGANAELKSLRKDPNVLFADDEIFIPEKQFKDLSKPTDQMHKFKRKGEPCKLKVQLMKAGKPRKNEKYVLNLDGKLIDGTTDGDGKTLTAAPIPNTWNRVNLLTAWVERGVAPGLSETVTSAQRSLPLCSYPTYPKYISGSTDTAASYRCTLP